MPPHNNDSEIIVTPTVKELRAQVQQWRNNGERVAFIPTMGALHQGHLSLVELGKKRADRTVASIFVNPAQFAPHEDLATYPRQEGADLGKLAEVGCDLAFLPDGTEMYPDGFTTSVKVDQLSLCLCGASRPHFFGGVATVVCKLLNQCQPDIAIFGEKDYQQLLIIQRMVEDLDMNIEIIGGEIIREEDGLAMSSRNAYLSKSERHVAGQLNVVMKSVIEAVGKNKPVEQAVADAKTNLLNAGFDKVDYFEIRRKADLSLKDADKLDPEELTLYRLFAAAFVGNTRLIDNMPLYDQ